MSAPTFRGSPLHLQRVTEERDRALDRAERLSDGRDRAILDNRRLREALTKIKEVVEADPRTCNDPLCCSSYPAWEIANAALEVQP